jgi:hypothetical protein
MSTNPHYSKHEGQFEVFYAESKDCRPMLQKWAGPGWYWWDVTDTGHPQCDPLGPFINSSAAYEDADR